ncbi:MAG TPA: D-alanyl-D-alanine carboxypeptidase/D-alanyl-D-alanine-endopeptidase [Gemmatimonadaceae bacterium]|nr:D-alanyl-D-alanine carboxypeptidase/D-alanyl-D-alanine-endopeptidase [Gemmatimonadaceae bacterium]
MTRTTTILSRWPTGAGLAAALLLLGAHGPVAASQQQGAGTQRSVLSGRRTPPPPAPASARAFVETENAVALRSDLHTMLDDGIRSGRWGAMVVSLTRGDTLLAHNAGELLTPASTMKLFTGALALERFGPDHQFSTDVLRDGPVGDDGILSGNLFLRGDGDPGFSNRYLRGEPDAPLDLLARFVASAGITRVRGDLVADATAFEDRRIPEGWLSRNLGYGYSAPVSALSVNENVVWVAVEPGRNGGSTVVTLEPSSSAIEVRSSVRTAAGRGARIVVRRAGRDAIEARGWIGARSSVRRYQLVIDDPALFTAGAFRDALARHGVEVDGVIRFGPTPGTTERVAGLPSPPLARMISVMNRESINHFAELIYRNVARGPSKGDVGSADRAYDLLHEFMVEKVGAAPGSIRATDGSGLSTLDRVTPRALIQLLDYAHRAPWSSVFHASLPVAGESELLRHRMRATPAQGNLHAKTGTTNAVISLAGYSTARNGEVLAFVFIYNGTDRWNARQTIDRMGVTLASFIRE